MLIVPVEEEADGSSLPELHAARMPPAPVATAPAPRPRSTDRRAMLRSCDGLAAASSGLISSPSYFAPRGQRRPIGHHHAAGPRAGVLQPGQHGHSASRMRARLGSFALTPYVRDF